MKGKIKFEGIMPALITPLCDDESINVDVLEKMLSGLLDEGADGFYIAGATGEGLALRPAERRVLAETAIKAVAHRKPCIVQVTSTDFSEAIALAKHAEAVGADAISATPPLFFGYSADEVYEYYKALASAVHIPLMIYYNPNAGFSMNASFAARCFEVDNITSIKWTSSDYYEMMELKRLTSGEMNIINGPDQMLLMGLNAGAEGGIGTNYSYMMPYFKGLYNSFKAGKTEEAYAYQLKITKAVTELIKHPFLPAAKVMMEAKGYAVGNATFPMTRFDKEEKKRIVSHAINAGVPGLDISLFD